MCKSEYVVKFLLLQIHAVICIQDTAKVKRIKNLNLLSIILIRLFAFSFVFQLFGQCVLHFSDEIVDLTSSGMNMALLMFILFCFQIPC